MEKNQKRCTVCCGNLNIIYSFGKMPLANTFLKKEEIRDEKKYDLTLSVCQKCKLLQLEQPISPLKLFSTYIYTSSGSKSFIAYCKDSTSEFIKRFHLHSGSLVFEIGSNDGVRLETFKKKGIKVLGIDPASNITAIATKKGIPTITDYFSLVIAKRLYGEGIRPDIILGSNVLAHIPNLRSLIKGVKLLLKNSGTAIFEFPYVQGLFEGKIDTIYHEHCYYFSLFSLDALFSQEGLDIYDVKLLSVQGGSLRIYCSHHGKHPISRRKTKLIFFEKKHTFDKVSTYKKLTTIIRDTKRKNLLLLNKFLQSHKIIAAYGASAKGVSLLNFLKLTNRDISFVVDTLPNKQGLYVPGVHSPVFPPDAMRKLRPDYLLLLCWNLESEVLPKLEKYRKSGGKIVIPIPNLRLLD